MSVILTDAQVQALHGMALGCSVSVGQAFGGGVTVYRG